MSGSRESSMARFVGSATAGILELSIFHPIDTLTKRIMSNKTNIKKLSELNIIVFRDFADRDMGRKVISLFPGIGYAAGYKVLQRIYKYGGQPVVRDFLTINYGKDFDKAFGRAKGKTIIHATAGSLIGVGEIILLPLDVLKIKRQTNIDALKGRSLYKIIHQERMRLYKGWQWTAARNAPGSFALFGGSAFTKEYVYKLEEYSDATWLQNFFASIIGASASIIVSSPLDVIKTRIQNRHFSSQESGRQILRKLIREEGISASFKGLVPKLLTTGPKLVFSFTVAQSIIPYFDSIFNQATVI